MAKIKKEIEVPSKHDIEIVNSIDGQIKLIENLTKILRKQNPNSAYNLEKDDVGSTVTHYISTGSAVLDTKISNLPEMGGWPVGRLNELIGWEASGKTLIAIHGMIDTLKQGGIPIYLDTEHRASRAWMKKIGLDVSRMIYSPMDTVEDVFKTLELVINSTMEKQLDQKRENRKIIFAVWDSVAMCSTISELAKGFDEAGMADKARVIGRSIRKVAGLLGAANTCFLCLNQLRSNIGAMGYDVLTKNTTPGGNAIKYQATVRVLMTKGRDIKIGPKSDEMVVGQEAMAKIVKNTVSGHGRKCNFNIYFNRGIVENSDEFLDYFLQTDRVQMENRDRGVFIAPTGETINFNRLKDWTEGLNLWENYKPYIIENSKKAMILDQSNPENVESMEDDEESIRAREAFDKLDIDEV